MTPKGEQTNSYVIFRVADTAFAMPCEATSELLSNRDNSFTKIPSSSLALSGVMNHRGRTLAVVDLRLVLGMPPRSSEVDAMADFIAAREQDHVAWLEALKVSAETGQKFTKATDPTLCAFGKWYEGVKSDPAARRALTGKSSTLSHLLDSFDGPHRKIHGVATKVLALAQEGNLKEARAVIDQTWNNELASMRVLFSEFVAEYRVTMKPMILVAEWHDRMVALLVDNVQSVMNVKASEFAPLPEIGREQRDELGTESFFLDGKIVCRVNVAQVFDLLQGQVDGVELLAS